MPNNLTFGPGVVEALPYATRAQAPYPPPVNSLPDEIEARAKSTAREILNAPSLLSFLASKQQKTLRSLPEGVRHPSADLLQTYVDEGIPDHTGPPWQPLALDTAISKGPHDSSCTLEMTTFIRGEMQRRIKDGFSILPLSADAILQFWERLKLSCIVAVTQANLCPRLILNL